MRNNIKTAVVQAGSIFMDRQRSLEKAAHFIAEAGAEKAQLIVLPEAFLPGYPRGLAFGTAVGERSEAGRALFRAYYENAIEIPGPETDALCKQAKEVAAHITIGVVERERERQGTLYCTLLFIGSDGTLLGKHRKIKPTAAERYIWGEGDGASLRVYDSDIGRLGGLICWENKMPLARMALYRQGVELYVAPTADNRETWQATIRHIADEGRCFVFASNQFITKADYPPELQQLPELEAAAEPFCRGGSAIIDPFGRYLAGPLLDEEGILYADCDLGQIAGARFDFDVVGHYTRPDIFHFSVKK